MAVKKRVGRPAYRGLTTYRDPQGRFEFMHSTEWTVDALTDDRDGVIVLPEVEEPATYFAVWITPLPSKVHAEDLDIVRSGLDAGLESLPSLVVEESSDEAIDDLLKLERLYTFTEDGFVRKRRSWTLYVDTWQYVVAFQAATVSEYDYWRAMGNYAFARFELPQALWFATDRDLSGNSVPSREDL